MAAKKTKQVQIPYDLLVKIYSYFENLPDPDPEARAIMHGLDQKLERMVNREYYTEYKTSTDKEKQELARQTYLDRVGMHKDFRY